MSLMLKNKEKNRRLYVDGNERPYIHTYFVTFISIKLLNLSLIHIYYMSVIEINSTHSTDFLFICNLCF